MATESKQIDGVVDDPENGGLKSGPCLTATTLRRRGRIADGLDDVL